MNGLSRRQPPFEWKRESESDARALGFVPDVVEATTNWLEMVVADVPAVDDSGFGLIFTVRANDKVSRDFLFQRKKALRCNFFVNPKRTP